MAGVKKYGTWWLWPALFLAAVCCWTAGAGHANAATKTLASSTLSVEVDDTFPNVVQYTHLPSGGVLYGNVTGDKTIRVNGTTYGSSQYAISSTAGAQQIDYHVVIGAIQVAIDFRLKVENNELHFDTTGIAENGAVQVNTVYLPHHQLVTVKDNQASATTAFTTWRELWAEYTDTIAPVSRLSGTGEKAAAYAFVNTDKVSAGLFDNLITQRYMSSWGTAGGDKFASVYSGEYNYRLLGQIQPLMSVAVAVTGDNNGDGAVNWQDAALWYRSKMKVPYGADLVSDAFVIKMNDVQRTNNAGNTFAAILDTVKQIYNLTNGRKTIIYLSGYQGTGHDSAFPDLSDISLKAGGAEKLNWLIEEAKKYNCTITLHVNNDDSYPSAGIYHNPAIWARAADGTPKPAWDFYESGSVEISHAKDILTGEAAARLDRLTTTLPGLSGLLYTDAFIPRISEEAGHTAAEEIYGMRQLAQLFNDKGFAFASEVQRPDLDDYQTYVEAYGNEGNQSRLDRFIKFNLMEHGVGGIDYGPSYIWSGLLHYTQMSYMSWHPGTLDTFMEAQFLHTLPVKYTKEHSLLSVKEDNRYQTAVFADGIEAKYDKFTDEYTLKQGADFYLARDSSVFMPQNGGSEILFYSKKGTTNGTWKLPPDWTGTGSLYAYKLTKQGRVFAGMVPVTNHSVALTAEAGQPYLLSAAAQPPQPLTYGEGESIANFGFESGDLSGWNPHSPDGDTRHIAVVADTTSTGPGNVNNYTLRISGRDGTAGSVEQTVSALTGGQTYALYGSMRAYKRTARLGVRGFGIPDTSMMKTSGTWDLVKPVIFTVPAGQTQATIYLEAEAGTADSYAEFNQIYIRPYDYPVMDKRDHLYYADFEDLDYDGFDKLEGQGGGPNVITQTAGEVISGTGSWFNTYDNDSRANTYDWLASNPDQMPLAGGRTYQISFKYRIVKQPDTGGYFYFTASRPDGSHPVGTTTFGGAAGQVYTESLNVTLDDYPDYRIVLGSHFGGKIVVDDIAIDENALANPGFETGGFDGWTQWMPSGQPSRVSVAQGGAREGDHYATAQATVPFAQTLVQSVKGLPAGTYRLSAWVKYSGGANGANLTLTDTGTSQTAQTFLPNAGVTDWTKFDTQLAVTSGDVKIELYIDALNASDKWVSWDQIKLERMDTPNPDKLANGSFDSGSLAGWTESYPTGQGSKASIVQGSSYEGTYHARAGAASPFAQTLSQNLDVPNGTYRLTAWVRYSGGANEASLVAEDSTGGRKSRADLNPAGVPGWAKYETELTVVSGKATIGLRIDATNAANRWVEWDRVRFERIGDGEMRNGSFETGTRSGWSEWVPSGQPSRFAIASGTAHAGSFYGRASASVPFSQTLSQRFANLAPGTYRLSAWARYSGGANAVKVALTDAGTHVQSAASLPATGTADWTRFETELFIASGSAVAELYIDAQNASGKWVDWDDVVLERVTNAVVNPGFDTGTSAGWSEWYPGGQGSKLTIDSQTSYSSGYSAKAASATPFAQTIAQIADVSPGRYRLSAMVYYSGGANTANLTLTDVGTGSSAQTVLPSGGTPGWRPFQTELFIASGQAKLELYIDALNASNRWIYWDSISLELIGEGNVGNGGFEDGSLSGWATGTGTNAHTTVGAGDAHAGRYGAKLYDASAYSQSLVQKFAGLDNGLYKLTAWVKYSGGAYATVTASDPGSPNMEINYQYNVYENKMVRELPTAGLANWTKIELYVPVARGAGEVQFLIVDGSGGKWLAVDDVSFEKVAELQGNGTNLLQNGSFETGDKTGWSEWYDAVSRATIKSDAPYDGSRYAEATHTGPFAQTLTQTLSGLSNGMYRISLAQKYSADGNTARVAVSQQDSIGGITYLELPQIGDTYLRSTWSRSNADWTTRVLYVPVTTGTLKLELYVDALNAGGVFMDWDQVRVEKCS